MQALLVLAHPLHDSLCAHLAGFTATGLRQRGTSVDKLDLYAEGFDPRLSASERTNHYGTPAPTPEITAQQARLADADVLVLVFPTWWFAVPAILKGWFDRVWAPGFAYDHGTPITPRLSRLKSCIVVTTLGSPWWIDRLVMRRPVRTMLKSALLGACAPQARSHMLSLHGAEAVSPDQLARFEARLTAAITRL